MIPREGSKPLDMSILKAALADGKMWCGLGLVVKREGENTHFEIVDGDVLVEVDLMPNGEPLLCRLGCAAGAAGAGVWRVPPVGSEVAIMIPTGDLEADCMIIAVLSTGEVPPALDADTLVIMHKGGKIHIETQGGDITIDSDSKVKIQGGGPPAARKDDPVNMGTWSHVPAAGAGVTPCQLVWTAPGGVSSPITAPVELDGKIKDGSSNTEIG